MYRLKIGYLSQYYLDESHPNLQAFFMELLSYQMVRFGVIKSTYFSKITNVEVCQVVDHAKNCIDPSSKLDLQK